nr:MAG TPA: helix-turn-helix domain protein [Caudoviricetes sp.]
MCEPKDGYLKLKAYLVESGITQGEVAKLLGISRSTFNCKLHRNGADFTAPEMRMLCQQYNLDANKFFLL